MILVLVLLTVCGKTSDLVNVLVSGKNSNDLVGFGFWRSHIFWFWFLAKSLIQPTFNLVLVSGKMGNLVWFLAKRVIWFWFLAKRVI